MSDKNRWNASRYNKHANFVSDLAYPLLELLDPKEDEDILDLGCGDGTLAVEISKFNSKVIGVDLSEDMVKKAKEKGIEAYVSSAIDLPYTNKFDAVFSNAVLHWVKNGDEALKNVSKCLKPKGRFIAEFGGYGNIEFLIEAMKEVFYSHEEFGEFKNPWYFPSDTEYKKLLQNNGFFVKHIELIPRPTKIDDISHWIDIFANGITSYLNATQKSQFKEEVREILKPKIYSKSDGWVADYVRLRLKAIYADR